MEQYENNLNFKISSASLLKYALPTILSSIFMNVYSIVDQLFVSNLLGTNALTAVSIAGPFLAVALAEVLCTLLSVFYFINKKSKFHYA